MKTRIACIVKKKSVLRCHFCNDKRSSSVLFIGIIQRLFVGHWARANSTFITVRKLQEKTFVTVNPYLCRYILPRSRFSTNFSLIVFVFLYKNAPQILFEISRSFTDMNDIYDPSILSS